MWYRTHGGAVLATTIDKYCYITCRFLPPFFDHRIRVVYSKIENRRAVDEIEHPSVRECLRHLGVTRGVEIHHDGDLPARSGLGSSSSFTVGLLHALHALKGQIPSRRELASESIYVEQELLKEAVGCQDQVMAALGGFHAITFHQDRDFSVRPVTISPARLAELNSHLMLLFTGVQRTASDIAQTYFEDLSAKERHLRSLQQMVDEGISILQDGGDISRFGRLLHEAWLSKRSLSNRVSNLFIEEIYTAALQSGALGGKLLGAGGGGFMLFFVPPEDQPKFEERMSRLIHVPFKPEFSGSTIIFYNPEEDYADQEQERERYAKVAFQELAQVLERERVGG
jgi:D-glycero-alpha-D-manno-heptose-7-phosphate kinase